jgi:hypothetical protein
MWTLIFISVIFLTLCLAGYIFYEFFTEETVIYSKDDTLYDDEEYLHPIGKINEDSLSFDSGIYRSFIPKTYQYKSEDYKDGKRLIIQRNSVIT